MISIGNFFFKYRNILFIFLYLFLFIPSPSLFTERMFGAEYYRWPLVIGLLITITGQIVRGATIGLAYIIRGGKDGKVYAETLVTNGIFGHCRNPLYVGNILMLLGVGILSNSLLYVGMVMPLFLLIYQAIVLAEENFLRGKFGFRFEQYCKQVNRWIPDLEGIETTFRNMKFNWKRWLLKEYNTQFIWLCGITVLLFLKYPVLTDDNGYINVNVMILVLLILACFYLFIRFLKKSGRMKE